MVGNEVALKFKTKSLFSAIAASFNKRMQWTAKSAAPLSLCFLPPLMRDVSRLKEYRD